MNRTWEYVGKIGVDAGLCWVGDPCYCVTPDANNHPAKTWDDFCAKLRYNEKDGVTCFPYSLGHEGLGVCVETGYGDGMYPIYVKRYRDGRVKEVRVVF